MYTQTGDDKEKGIGSFRFWTDARRFKGSEGKCIVQKALFESGVILPKWSHSSIKIYEA